LCFAFACQVGRWINVDELKSVAHITCDSRAASGAVQAVITLTDKDEATDLYEYVFPWWVTVPRPSQADGTAGFGVIALCAGKLFRQ
jgi:hypothetical protein